MQDDISRDPTLVGAPAVGDSPSLPTFYSSVFMYFSSSSCSFFIFLCPFLLLCIYLPLFCLLLLFCFCIFINFLFYYLSHICIVVFPIFVNLSLLFLSLYFSSLSSSSFPSSLSRLGMFLSLLQGGHLLILGSVMQRSTVAAARLLHGPSSGVIGTSPLLLC